MSTCVFLRLRKRYILHKLKNKYYMYHEKEEVKREANRNESEIKQMYESQLLLQCSLFGLYLKKIIINNKK